MISDDSTSLKCEYKRGLDEEKECNLQDFIMQFVQINKQPIPPGAAIVPPFPQQKEGVPAEASSQQKTDAQQHTRDGKSPAPEPGRSGVGNVSARKRNVSGSTIEPIVLSFWDFAGQDLYYTTHQTFLSSRAIFVVVFNLCNDLDKPVPVPATSRPTNQGSTSDTSKMTPLQYLDFWMRSIFTYTKENATKSRLEQKSPPIFIVGTHRNSVGGEDLPDKERKVLLEKIFTRIRKEIYNKPYFRYVVSNFYAIENSLDPDNEKIVKLRGHIESTAQKEPYMGEAIPLRWLEFDEKKLEVAKSDGLPVLTLKQVKDDIGVKDEMELLTMLKFYHDLGHIIYFGGDDGKKSQALKDVIIRDPQWLIDAFKKVITVTAPREQIKDFARSWTRLKEKGILEDVLIDHMWKDILPKKQALLDLMDKFDLVCERVDQPREEGQSSPAVSTEPRRFQRMKSQSDPEVAVSYYVPSMLQRQTPQGSQPESIQQKNASVLFVDFHEFLPDGLFHRLVVRAVRWSQQLGGTNPGLQYDRANFYVDDQHEFALQMVRQKDLACVKVSVMKVPVVQTKKRRPKQDKKNAKKTPSPDVTLKVRGFVEKNLQNLKDMWIKRISYDIGVQCPCERGGLHFLRLDECLTTLKVVCRIQDRQTLIETDKFQAMFNPDSSDDEPTPLEKREPMSDRHFREIAADLGEEWEKLATYLGFNEQDIYKFKCESKSVDYQIFHMLVKWRKRCSGKVDKMRKDLVGALKKIDKHELAEKVEKY